MKQYYLTFLFILFLPLCLACPPSSAARLVIKDTSITSENLSLLIQNGSTTYEGGGDARIPIYYAKKSPDLNWREFPFESFDKFYLNISKDVQNFRVEIGEKVLTFPVSDLYFAPSYAAYRFPSEEVRYEIYDENFNWKTGDSIKKYNNSVVKFYYDDVIISEFRIEFVEPWLIECPGLIEQMFLPILSLIIFISFLLFIVFMIIKLIRKKIKKSTEAVVSRTS